MTQNLITLTVVIVLGLIVARLIGQGAFAWLSSAMSDIFKAVGKLVLIAVIGLILYWWFVDPSHGQRTYEFIVNMIRSQRPAMPSQDDLIISI